MTPDREKVAREIAPCDVCHGRGDRIEIRESWFGAEVTRTPKTVPCWSCEGSGVDKQRWSKIAEALRAAFEAGQVEMRERAARRAETRFEADYRLQANATTGQKIAAEIRKLPAEGEEA